MALIKQESEDIKIEEVFCVKTEETEEQIDFKMTRRKFKPCPSCQAPNQVSRKTCISCFTTISNKGKLMAKKVSLDREWGERVLKNRNAGRVVDSANIAVKKLSALGYLPILFFAKKDKTGKRVADVVTHLPPTEDNQKILATMRMAYNFVLIKQGNTTTLLPEPQHQGQPKPQHQGQPEPQHQGQPEPQHQHQGQPEPQHQGQPEPQHQGQPEPQHQGQPEPQHQGQPEPQHQHQGQPEPPHQSQPEPQHQHQGQSDLQHQGQPEPQPVSLPLKEQPPSSKKRKCYQKFSSQQILKYDPITGRKINEGQAEVKVELLPCSESGNILEETWEPAFQFPSDFKINRRKFKPCPSCKFSNQVSRKTCISCFTTISNKSKLMAKKVSLDREWGERVLKNRNAGRVVDSANIAVKKLSALGYLPILFFGKKDKTGKRVADVVTHLPPTEDNLKIVATMRMAYNFVLIKQGNSTTTLLEPQHQGQPEPQPVSLPLKEQPSPPKKRKCCQKCDPITGQRINEEQAEVKVEWLPCSECGNIWEETWESACQFPSELTTDRMAHTRTVPRFSFQGRLSGKQRGKPGQHITASNNTRATAPLT
ncbi:uncharacterized protein LOC120475098 isoform X2 [Pimephales promelas]|uniref:uncharacterized protein LOC120475098 isoform X2 n=1 Tax=Pimephales promelas TaxID=90988 RepID=UPI001955B056|nr:uncharacterized protein LOC120475098 isoform X2 [Pimephales promelas]